MHLLSTEGLYMKQRLGCMVCFSFQQSKVTNERFDIALKLQFPAPLQKVVVRVIIDFRFFRYIPLNNNAAYCI